MIKKNFSKEGASSFYEVSIPHTVLLGNIISLSVGPLFCNFSFTHKMKNHLSISDTAALSLFFLCLPKSQWKLSKKYIKFSDMYSKLMFILPVLPVEICPSHCLHSQALQITGQTVNQLKGEDL